MKITVDINIVVQPIARLADLKNLDFNYPVLLLFLNKCISERIVRRVLFRNDIAVKTHQRRVSKVFSQDLQSPRCSEHFRFNPSFANIYNILVSSFDKFTVFLVVLTYLSDG